MTGRLTSTSKFLAYVLRHRPEAIGITLDEAGWVAVEELLAALARHGRPVTVELLDQLVTGTDKQRFEIREGRIRAAQGHSIPVDLRLAPQVPPQVLYHGTVARFLPRIRVEGLAPGERTHVHLSADPETAARVGARRGEPVVLRIDAAGMHRAGLVFYRAANGVWLTSQVPPGFLA
ncbi:RNA 2'-phosphotransferase [Micromonospora sp. DT229]|uniref:RNA 2'-phosphotransferase n=1 Tax=Micromonospora sp. DT229 TaxID=3393430 RepID=UPI003CF1EFE6